MRICSSPIGLVIEPLSLVNITIRVIQNASSIGLIHFPLPNILTPISPYLRPISLTHTILPLSFIHDAIIELNGSEFGDLIIFKSRLDKLIILCSLAPVY